VASRLSELYGRPSIVLNCEDGVAHGSGRSVGDFDLHSILDATRDLLLEGGGHQMACGLTLEEARLGEFRERALQVAAASLRMEDLALAVEADCLVRGRDVSPQLAREFEKLEPCGTGNPEPRLLMKGARLMDSRPLGKTGDHLAWTLESEGRRFQGVWWSPGTRAANLHHGSAVDVCFVPEMNQWKDNVSLRLNIKEARQAERV
jgi:single-stranded-DNA-specific exonuclease